MKNSGAVCREEAPGKAATADVSHSFPVGLLMLHHWSHCFPLIKNFCRQIAMLPSYDLIFASNQKMTGTSYGRSFKWLQAELFPCRQSATLHLLDYSSGRDQLLLRSLVSKHAQDPSVQFMPDHCECLPASLSRHRNGSVQ